MSSRSRVGAWSALQPGPARLPWPAVTKRLHALLACGSVCPRVCPASAGPRHARLSSPRLGSRHPCASAPAPCAATCMHTHTHTHTITHPPTDPPTLHRRRDYRTQPTSLPSRCRSPGPDKCAPSLGRAHPKRAHHPEPGAGGAEPGEVAARGPLGEGRGALHQQMQPPQTWEASETNTPDGLCVCVCVFNRVGGLSRGARAQGLRRNVQAPRRGWVGGRTCWVPLCVAGAPSRPALPCLQNSGTLPTLSPAFSGTTTYRQDVPT